MVTRSLRLAFGAFLAVAGALGFVACDKMPLVAPTGTVITLIANSTVLPVDGSIEITAIAIMGGATTTTGGTTGGTTATPATAAAGQGTPVHNGTRVTFTTTLGRVEPQEAETHNGQATVRLFANNSSGVATIRAFSGGASSNELKVNVGAAAAARLDLVANPTTLPSTGGVTNVTARVFDTNGNPLSGVPVSFSVETGGGTFSSSTVVSDAGGSAATTLTTNRETTIVATAGVGGSSGGTSTTPLTSKVTIRVNTASTLTISSTTAAPVQNQPVNFTITPGGGTGTAVIRNVAVNFGDGEQFTLGSISGATAVSHVYEDSGTFQVTASGIDVNGETTAGATIVSVTEQLPLAVTLTAAPSTARVGVDTVTFTANVSGGSPIRYIWNFGDGTQSETTGGSTTHFYPVGTPLGSKQVTVRVLSNNAGEGLGQTTVIITTP